MTIRRLRSLLVVFVVAGCATAPKPAPIPVCDKPDAKMAMSPEGPGVFFDLDNMKAMIQVMKDLQAGKCQMEK